MNEIHNCFLFKALNDVNTELAQLIINTWKHSEPLLRHAAATHPYHTSHGPDHSLALLDIECRAIKPIWDNVILNDSELYILICATLLHDIGMVGEANPSEDIRENIRRTHHLLSANYIRNNWQILSLDSPHVDAISEVSASHRKINIEKDITDYPIGIKNTRPPRIKLCAALLRFADELHITYDRVPYDIDTLKLPPESIQHFIAHAKTEGRVFDVENGKIIFSAKISDENIDSFIQKLKIKIQEEIDSIQTIFIENRIPYIIVDFIEKREELIRKKLLKLLFEKGKATISEMVQKTKEKKENIEKYIRTDGELYFTINNNENDDEVYSISVNETLFEELSKEFLHNHGHKSNSIIFIQSEFSQNILESVSLGLRVYLFHNN